MGHTPPTYRHQRGRPAVMRFQNPLPTPLPLPPRDDAVCDIHADLTETMPSGENYLTLTPLPPRHPYKSPFIRQIEVGLIKVMTIPSDQNPISNNSN